ncbi:IucA/IucC family siderophore biosynthesis protein [Paenibacillus sp. J22TS3]|uniref:IucA/IucC family protein n=1 Tax=Paenibacillus sp. J22TS3 TaxID=2807192 RepID=UPI001B08D766|nr:IucA/IucC family protein [Paenibacillus sp. J22TS3]GIP23231.1 L-2,3-diaminopropanoate--citrate ligase SbnE [Paenibacillus sp. J22TS3]
MQDNNTALQYAEQAASTRLLNCYIRETETRREMKNPYELHLVRSGRSFRLNLSCVSLTGHHRYVFPIWGKDAGEEAFHELQFSELLDYILEELTLASKEPINRAKEIKLTLQKKVLNSVRKTALYVLNGDKRAASKPDYGYVRSEQSLYFGHPFHPTPKSSEGFSPDDVERYAPERGTAFRLEYWLVHPELFQEDWLSESTFKMTWLAKEKALVAAAAKEHEKEYRLLPCHPWQAAYLKKSPAVQALSEAGKLRWVGSLESEPVYPTASVRTVWSPEQGLFLKLPLHVHITNFVRTNSPDQCRRSLDAAQVWKVIGASFRCEGFGILQEFGSLSIRDTGLAEETAVLLRESVAGLISPQEQWHVAATMLEDELEQPVWLPPTGKKAKIWVERYTSIYLFPVLRLFAEEGYSLEAHVQNTLICLEDGLPVHCLTRDLEGVSISSRVAEAKGWVDTVIPASSPVLYNEEEAWLRLLYYNLTNHMSHMLAAVSRSSGVDEAVLWDISFRVLSDYAERGSDSVRYWVKRLAAAPTLPAKANLVSWFAFKGDSPEYVDLPNPFYQAAVVESFAAGGER